MALGGRTAQAAGVSCGDTITADTTLHHNLVDCPNSASSSAPTTSRSI
jgi:hypothetical protein